MQYMVLKLDRYNLKKSELSLVSGDSLESVALKVVGFTHEELKEALAAGEGTTMTSSEFCMDGEESGVLIRPAK